MFLGHRLRPPAPSHPDTHSPLLGVPGPAPSLPLARAAQPALPAPVPLLVPLCLSSVWSRVDVSRLSSPALDTATTPSPSPPHTTATYQRPSISTLSLLCQPPSYLNIYVSYFCTCSSVTHSLCPLAIATSMGLSPSPSLQHTNTTCQPYITSPRSIAGASSLWRRQRATE